MVERRRAGKQSKRSREARQPRTRTYADAWFAERYHRHWEPVLSRPAIALLDHLEVNPGVAIGRVLDIGAGTGLLTIELARRWPEATIVACDPAAAMLQVVRRRASDVGLDGRRLELVEGTAERVPLADASVDLAVSSFVFQLVTDRRQALREAFRVLRPGATLGYVTWLAGDRTFRPGLAIDAALGAETDTDWSGGVPRVGDVPSAEAAAAELREAGFASIRVQAGELTEAWTIDRYIAYAEHCRNTAAFAGLDARQSALIRARLRSALEGVPSDAFLQRGDIVYAVGRRPASTALSTTAAPPTNEQRGHK